MHSIKYQDFRKVTRSNTLQILGSRNRLSTNFVYSRNLDRRYLALECCEMICRVGEYGGKLQSDGHLNSEQKKVNLSRL